MDLRYWQGRGVDVSTILGTPMFQDPEHTLHGGPDCTDLEYGTTMSRTKLDLGDELCEGCWTEGLTADGYTVVEDIDNIQVVENSLRTAFEKGVLAAGFPILQAALHQMGDVTGAATRWASAARVETVRRFEAEVTDRAALQEQVLAELLPGVTPTGNEGLVLLPRWHGGLAPHASTATRAAAAWWVPALPMFVMRAPLEVVEHLEGTCGITEASVSVLRVEDTEQVVQTAVHLYDTESQVFSTLANTLEAARSL